MYSPPAPERRVPPLPRGPPPTARGRGSLQTLQETKGLCADEAPAWLSRQNRSVEL